MDAASIWGVAVASLMKLIHKVVEQQFATQRPDMFRECNGTCQQLDPTSRAASKQQQSGITWIYTARYMLPVLGGALATTGLGYVRVLQIGGCLMLLATGLMTAAARLGWMCSQPQLCLAIWLLLPLIFALIHPNAMHAIFRWHRPHSVLVTAASAVYCGSAVLGGGIGFLLPLLGSWIDSNVTLIGVAISVVFLALSSALREEPDGYAVPTKARMFRYCRIFAALIIFFVAVSDCRPEVYAAEIRYRLASADEEDSSASSCLRVWSPGVVKVASMTATCAITAVIACCTWHFSGHQASTRQLPSKPRILAGILIESAVSLSLMALNLSTLVSSVPVTCAIFIAASGLDGLATSLTMVAAYELMDAICDRRTRPLVIGIVFTVLGLANLLGRLLLMLLQGFPAGNPVLRPCSGCRPLFFVYHLVVLLLLLLCLLYHWFISFRLAHTMIGVSDDSGAGLAQPSQVDENRPLLSGEGNLQFGCQIEQ